MYYVDKYVLVVYPVDSEEEHMDDASTSEDDRTLLSQGEHEQESAVSLPPERDFEPDRSPLPDTGLFEAWRSSSEGE